MVVILFARRVCLLPLAVTCRGPRLPLLQAHNRVEGPSYPPKQMAMNSLASEAHEEAEQMTGDVGESRRCICMEIKYLGLVAGCRGILAVKGAPGSLKERGAQPTHACPLDACGRTATLMAQLSHTYVRYDSR